MICFYTHRSVPYLVLLIKASTAADGNKCKETLADIMRQESLSWKILSLHQVSLLRAQEMPLKRRWKEGKSPSGRRTIEQSPMNQRSKEHMGSQRLRLQSPVLHRCTLGPLHIHFSYQLNIFMGLLIIRTSGSLSLVPSVGILFLLLDRCVQLQYDSSCFILLNVILS